MLKTINLYFVNFSIVKYIILRNKYLLFKNCFKNFNLYHDILLNSRFSLSIIKKLNLFQCNQCFAIFET